MIGPTYSYFYSVPTGNTKVGIIVRFVKKDGVFQKYQNAVYTLRLTFSLIFERMLVIKHLKDFRIIDIRIINDTNVQNKYSNKLNVCHSLHWQLSIPELVLWCLTQDSPEFIQRSAEWVNSCIFFMYKLRSFDEASWRLSKFTSFCLTNTTLGFLLKIQIQGLLLW